MQGLFGARPALVSSSKGLLVCVHGGLVAFDPGLELGELAVGGALGAAGHLAAGGEPCEGLRHPQGFGGIAVAFVDGGQPLVGMAAHEPFRDALLEEVDGPPGVAGLEGALGLLVALHRGLEEAEGVFFCPDPLPFLLLEPIEGRGRAFAPLGAPEYALETPENQTLPSRYARPSISTSRSAFQPVSAPPAAALRKCLGRHCSGAFDAGTPC